MDVLISAMIVALIVVSLDLIATKKLKREEF